jgi:phosphohistidine phosphatase
MKLLVIRHAVAMDQEAFARTEQSDDLRPLSAEGTREMEQVAKGLRAEIKTLDLLATSPLVRARQTADIVADAYGIGPAEITDLLVPGASLEEFEESCASSEERKVVAIVGHEPHLSCLVTWLMTGRSQSRIRLRKGGACLLEFESQVRRDSGTLNWLLTPRQLARSSG